MNLLSLDMIIFFYKKNKIRNKQLLLEEVGDNLFGKVKESYFPKYYTIKITQTKSCSFYIVIREKKVD